MERVAKKRLALYTGRSHVALAQEIADCLGEHLWDANIVEFANGEVRPRFTDSVRGCDVFVIQSHAASEGRSVNDSIMEQLVMIDAAKRASAKRITAICPFYGYARQDRKAEGREPITAKLISDMFDIAGAKRLISLDLHSGQIQGFFNGPVDHLTAMPVLVDYLKRNGGSDLVIVSPDAGRVKVSERYSQQLDSDLAIVHKRRPKGVDNKVVALDVVGQVDGRRCVLIDDMIDTAGTICAASEILLERGASEVWAAATHAVLSGPAIERLKNSRLDRVIVTNTLPLPSEKRIDKLETLSVARVIADAIDAVFEDTSVSEIFGGQNQG
jgi:ribose-phosphate pyrophosphokinase